MVQLILDYAMQRFHLDVLPVGSRMILVGRVVAYFETPNGGVRSATVDSVIDGYRVKAINIDEQYLLLVNVKTGIEEKMTMQGARRTK